VRKRALVLAACATIAALAGGVTLLGSGFRQLPFAVGFARLNPETLDWNGKLAWGKCAAAISGVTRWPKTDALACQAMHMRADEAPLSPRQAARLSSWVDAMAHCPKL